MKGIAALDAFTREHLRKWIATQWQYEHDALLEEIDKALSEEPGLIDTLSWPEIAYRGRATTSEKPLFIKSIRDLKGAR